MGLLGGAGAVVSCILLGVGVRGGGAGECLEVCLGVCFGVESWDGVRCQAE